MNEHDELVEKMLDAFQIGNHSDVWRERMSAVLRVCVEELLNHTQRGSQENRLLMRGNSTIEEDFNAIMDLRRARYSPPKPNTPEERITIVEWLHDPTKWAVLIDGWNSRDSMTFDKRDRQKAERYRAGWIAELKEQAK